MASAVLRQVSRFSPSLLQRWATAAAAVPLTEVLPQLENEAAVRTRKEPEEVRISKLANGITVASLENHSISSNISVFVKAGSRHETYDQLGLTHLLRRCAFLASGDRSAFGIAREIDQIGGSLSATSTREHIVYSSEFLRGNIEPVMDILGSVVNSPQFQHWEVDDQRPKVELDIATAENQPSLVVLEGLHHGAFRNTLSNPLYCPSYNVSKFTHEDLKSYVEEWFTGRRTTILGVGTSHDELVKCAESSFGSVPEGLSITEEQSEYVGGFELRVPSGSTLGHAAIVCKGASRGNQKDLLSAGVLQHLLGVANYIKWGSNTASARLSKAAAGTIDGPYAVTSLNLNYSDNGLFGMYAISDGNATGKLLKTVVHEFNEVARGNISDADLSRAKNQLKASYLMTTESQATLVEDIGMQASLRGSYTPLSDTIRQVDSVTKEDVIKFAKYVFGTRPTLAAHGNLGTTPRLDHLLTEVSLK